MLSLNEIKLRNVNQQDYVRKYWGFNKGPIGLDNYIKEPREEGPIQLAQKVTFKLARRDIKYFCLVILNHRTVVQISILGSNC